MGLLLLIIEIIVAGFFAVRLGREAHDKGFSNVLFIFLAGILWFASRVIGSFIGLIVIQSWLGAMVLGWLFAIVSYCIFYYFLSRIKDKEIFNEHEADWKKRNSISSTETGKPGEK